MIPDYGCVPFSARPCPVVRPAAGVCSLSAFVAPVPGLLALRQSMRPSSIALRDQEMPSSGSPIRGGRSPFAASRRDRCSTSASEAPARHQPPGVAKRRSQDPVEPIRRRVDGDRHVRPPCRWMLGAPGIRRVSASPRECMPVGWRMAPASVRRMVITRRDPVEGGACTMARARLHLQTIGDLQRTSSRSGPTTMHPASRLASRARIETLPRRPTGRTLARFRPTGHGASSTPSRGAWRPALPARGRPMARPPGIDSPDSYPSGAHRPWA
ncbi:hypothetical protein SAMN05192568_106819 [Methylobacterium pseudosasicola]|uniref:Uncharacterized protein n=1 Tax=Methylobacterium pseudosasicola TaxID=582667 RepID=A0A1I4UE90_9HYPH|nr:hypothetical protein SAMN05192568_106819 [Methylobacterium pseudosasicola]